MNSRKFIPILIAASATTLGGCAMNQPDKDPVTDAPAARVVGEPVNCVQTNLIRDTEVHGDRTIDFRMNNGKIYRNTLPTRCSSLGFEERFGYKSTNGRLCNVDTITVLQSGGISGPTCGLGKFVPVELEKD